MVNISTVSEILNLNKGKLNLLRVNSYYIDKNYCNNLIEQIDDLMKELKTSKSMLSKQLKLIESNNITDDLIDALNVEEDRIVTAQQRQRQHEKQYKEGSNSVVYLMHNVETNKLKIGTTYYVNKRLSVIKSSVGCDLVLLYTAKGGTNLEKDLHKKFSQFRTIGEWFNYDESIVKCFESMQ